MDTFEELQALLRDFPGDPYCYHAHVPGKGYVNDGKLVATRADFERQWARDKESEITNLGWAPGYAEPGYTQPVKSIILANWNLFPDGVIPHLEGLGFVCEWSDEWAQCGDCQRLVRTEPDCFSWEPYYLIDGGEFVCLGCADKAGMHKE